MNKFAWPTALLVMGGYSIAALPTACTVTASSGDDAGTGNSASSSSSSSSSGSSSGSGASSSSSGSSSSSSSGAPGDDGGSDGSATTDGAPACNVAVDTGNAGCDQCIQTTSCDMDWCACAGNPMNVDDAGSSGCIQYFQCVLDCIRGSPDAGIAGGTPSDCYTICGPGSLYSTTEQMEGQNLYVCIQSNCSTPATCGQ